jgi:D-serine deaminase-like pyridoxal phosphate-dependent protein
MSSLPNLEGVDTPALLVDAEVLSANIARMAGLFTDRSQRLRPHAKTHKCAEIARMQMAAGAIGICCAKLSEAEALVSAGITDILITTPIIGNAKVARLVRLARHAAIKAVADSETCIRAYAMASEAHEIHLNVLIEVDVGQNRCGVRPGSSAFDLLELLSTFPSLRFCGLQGYQGAAQGIMAQDERFAANESALKSLLFTADLVRRRGYQIDVLTGGGSGSVEIDLQLGGLTELQPGSYVFMDTTYDRIQWGDPMSAPLFVPSLSVLTTVISRNDPKRAIVDVGWKALSSDAGLPRVKNRPDLRFDFAGDEHGVLQNVDGDAVKLEVGEQVELIPSHCDTTVALHDWLYVVRKGALEDRWLISARGCFQ